MWTLPRSDLKYRLTLRIVAVSAFCFGATSAGFLVDADWSARARIDSIAGIAAKELELQRSKLDWVYRPRAEFPDLQNIATALLVPSLCIAYRANSGEVLQRVCGGARREEADPPQLFTMLYRNLFHPERETVRAVSFRGRKVGDAVVSLDPATVIATAWHEAGRLIVVMVITLVLLSGLVYAALARALRPTRLICAGLERIAANDLSARLPPFDLAELSAIREVFNHLAESLASALAERTELTRRLIALQDDERRHLARELHDEFGQCLTAIRALAASAGQSAAQNCPDLLPECDSIARTASHMMETLRGTLFRLRPPDVDELGLAASLEGLIAGWNSRSRGRTRFEIRLRGGFASVPAAAAADLYRIAQEAVTNAAKHAEATRVVLDLTLREMPGFGDDGASREVALSVVDDGRARDHEPPVSAGMGLLGMRERVATLGGRMSFEAGPTTGSVLRVVIPLAPAEGCETRHMACPA